MSTDLKCEGEKACTGEKYSKLDRKGFYVVKDRVHADESLFLCVYVVCKHKRAYSNSF